MNKEEQKQHLIDLMRMDEGAGLYDDPPRFIYKPDSDKFKKLRELHEEAKLLAEQSWEKCDGCDDNDKNFWIGGFIKGYISAKNK